MDAPAYQSLHQLLHSPQRGYPGAVDGLLAMDDIRAGIEGACAALSHKRDLAPLPGSADGKLTSRIAGAGVDGALHAVTVRHLHDAVHRLVRREHIVHQSQLLCQLHAVFVHLHADQHVGSHGLCQHQSRQPYRAKAGHQHRVVSADADLLDGFINRSESAGHLRAVLVGQLIGKGDQVLLVRKAVRSHSAVSLPAVCLTEAALAGNVVASAAVVAHAAAGNMINDDSVALLEASEALALLYDHAAGLMSRNHSGDIAFRPLSHMRSVDAADIASADRRGLRLDQHLSMARLRDLKLLHLHRAVAGKRRPPHSHFFHFFFPFLPPLRRR